MRTLQIAWVVPDQVHVERGFYNGLSNNQKLAPIARIHAGRSPPTLALSLLIFTTNANIVWSLGATNQQTLVLARSNLT